MTTHLLYPDGEIIVGQRFLWEPNNPRAMCYVEVVELKRDQYGGLWVGSRAIMSPPEGFPVGEGVHWNEESRWREAAALIVIPDEYEPFPED